MPILTDLRQRPSERIHFGRADQPGIERRCHTRQHTNSAITSDLATRLPPGHRRPVTKQHRLHPTTTICLVCFGNTGDLHNHAIQCRLPASNTPRQPGEFFIRTLINGDSRHDRVQGVEQLPLPRQRSNPLREFPSSNHQL